MLPWTVWAGDKIPTWRSWGGCLAHLQTCNLVYFWASSSSETGVGGMVFCGATLYRRWEGAASSSKHTHTKAKQVVVAHSGHPQIYRMASLVLSKQVTKLGLQDTSREKGATRFGGRAGCCYLGNLARRQRSQVRAAHLHVVPSLPLPPSQ